MSFTVAEVLQDARELVQDTSPPYRYDDAFMVRKFNQVIRKAVVLRPDLFTQITTIACTAGAMQSCPADSVRIMDVLTSSTGEAVKEVNQDVLDMMAPGWELTGQGPTKNWMRYPRDPNRFYVYPAATAAVALEILYSKCPAMLTTTDIVPIQDAYYPFMVDGLCAILESIDAEHVESGRSKMFQDSFMSGLTGGLQARRIADTDTAAGPPGEAA
jgi:hypothetical protein